MHNIPCSYTCDVFFCHFLLFLILFLTLILIILSIVLLIFLVFGTMIKISKCLRYANTKLDVSESRLKLCRAQEKRYTTLLYIHMFYFANASMIDIITIIIDISLIFVTIILTIIIIVIILIIIAVLIVIVYYDILLIIISITILIPLLLS